LTRVVAVNGSPMMDKGNTERILRPFLEGAKEAGAEVEVFYAKKLDIQPCRGELLCWGRNLGKCHIKDDMESVYPALRRADIMVLATPVYIPLPGEMQNFLNRLCPLVNPVLTRKNGRTREVSFRCQDQEDSACLLGRVVGEGELRDRPENREGSRKGLQRRVRRRFAPAARPFACERGPKSRSSLGSCQRLRQGTRGIGQDSQEAARFGRAAFDQRRRHVEDIQIDSPPYPVTQSHQGCVTRASGSHRTFASRRVLQTGLLRAAS